MRRMVAPVLLALLLAGCGAGAKPALRLAYVAGGRVHVLGSTAQPVAGGNPAWSQDGRWLGFLSPEGALEVEGYDGQSAQAVQGLSGPVPPGGFVWSPTSDMMAVAPEKSGLWLVSGGARLLAAGDTQVYSLAWSPDGQSVAYVVTEPYTDVVQRSDALYTVPIAGGTAKRVYAAHQAGIELAAWNLFWLDPLHSSSIAADGLPLMDVANGRTLATTLVRRDWLSFSGQRVLLVAGQGRELDRNKALAICELPAATCRTLPQPAASVSIDPAWSPDGQQMAFVRSGGLWLASGDGGGAKEVAAAGAGVSGPQWSPDGKDLFYLRPGSVWRYVVASAKVSQVASGGVSSFALGR
jgi:dipeptidyl aminopeptidase/acylaminoacyl peptidase